MRYLVRLREMLKLEIKLEDQELDLAASTKSRLFALIKQGQKDYGRLGSVINGYLKRVVKGQDSGDLKKKAVKALEKLRGHLREISVLFEANSADKKETSSKEEYDYVDNGKQSNDHGANYYEEESHNDVGDGHDDGSYGDGVAFK